MTFKKALIAKLKAAEKNQFGRDNFDEYRFGSYEKVPAPPSGMLQKVKDIVKPVLKPGSMPANHASLREYLPLFEEVYGLLSEHDQRLLVELMAYRILGFRKVKLSRNNPEYWAALETVAKLKDDKDSIDPGYIHFVLHRFNLQSIGYDIDFYFNDFGVAVDFLIEQYAYKKDGQYIVAAAQNDVVLDIGGCWGDTALYFAHKVGPGGKVYSFEFIPGNIRIHDQNRSLNPALAKRIQLIPHPVSDKSDQTIYFMDRGPSSTLSLSDFEGKTGSTSTITIDDFVERNGINKVDFIKMDIEGAELYALEGAVNTIRKFKPKLAIANYHSVAEMASIPKWIADMKLGYKLYLGHYTIHAEETIIFAKPE